MKLRVYAIVGWILLGSSLSAQALTPESRTNITLRMGTKDIRPTRRVMGPAEPQFTRTLSFPASQVRQVLKEALGIMLERFPADTKVRGDIPKEIFSLLPAEGSTGLASLDVHAITIEKNALYDRVHVDFETWGTDPGTSVSGIGVFLDEDNVPLEVHSAILDQTGGARSHIRRRMILSPQLIKTGIFPVVFVAKDSFGSALELSTYHVLLVRIAPTTKLMNPEAECRAESHKRSQLELKVAARFETLQNFGGEQTAADRKLTAALKTCSNVPVTNAREACVRQVVWPNRGDCFGTAFGLKQTQCSKAFFDREQAWGSFLELAALAPSRCTTTPQRDSRRDAL